MECYEKSHHLRNQMYFTCTFWLQNFSSEVHCLLLCKEMFLMSCPHTVNLPFGFFEWVTKETIIKNLLVNKEKSKAENHWVKGRLRGGVCEGLTSQLLHKPELTLRAATLPSNRWLGCISPTPIPDLCGKAFRSSVITSPLLPSPLPSQPPSSKWSVFNELNNFHACSEKEPRACVQG